MLFVCKPTLNKTSYVLYYVLYVVICVYKYFLTKMGYFIHCIVGLKCLFATPFKGTISGLIIEASSKKLQLELLPKNRV